MSPLVYLGIMFALAIGCGVLLCIGSERQRRRTSEANEAFKRAWNRQPGAFIPARGPSEPSVPLTVTHVDHARRTVRVSAASVPRSSDDGLLTGIVLGSMLSGGSDGSGSGSGGGDGGSSSGDCGGGSFD